METVIKVCVPCSIGVSVESKWTESEKDKAIQCYKKLGVFKKALELELGVTLSWGNDSEFSQAGDPEWTYVSATEWSLDSTRFFKEVEEHIRTAAQKAADLAGICLQKQV